MSEVSSTRALRDAQMMVLIAERVKLEAEAHELSRPFYARSTFWGASITALAAGLTATYAINSNLFDAEAKIRAADLKVATAETRFVEASQKLLEFETQQLGNQRIILDTKITQERQKNQEALANQRRLNEKVLAEEREKNARDLDLERARNLEAVRQERLLLQNDLSTLREQVDRDRQKLVTEQARLGGLSASLEQRRKELLAEREDIDAQAERLKQETSRVVMGSYISEAMSENSFDPNSAPVESLIAFLYKQSTNHVLLNVFLDRANAEKDQVSKIILLGAYVRAVKDPVIGEVFIKSIEDLGPENLNAFRWLTTRFQGVTSDVDSERCRRAMRLAIKYIYHESSAIKAENSAYCYFGVYDGVIVGAPKKELSMAIVSRLLEEKYEAFSVMLYASFLNGVDTNLADLMFAGQWSQVDFDPSWLGQANNLRDRNYTPLRGSDDWSLLQWKMFWEREKGNYTLEWASSVVESQPD